MNAKEWIEKFETLTNKEERVEMLRNSGISFKPADDLCVKLIEDVLEIKPEWQALNSTFGEAFITCKGLDEISVDVLEGVDTQKEIENAIKEIKDKKAKLIN